MLLICGSLFPHMFNFNMLLLLILLAHLFTLHIPACSTVFSTISPSQGLVCGDKLVSLNGKFVLGFFQTSSKSYNTLNWYLGIWFNKVPKITPVWVANCDNPIKEPALVRFTISHDGNLVILNQVSNSIIWSSQVRIRTNTTIAVLMNNGNLVLQNTSSSSDMLWQSFDHPTDTFLPGAKLGRDKRTGLTRRLVSKKNLIDPACGQYCYQLDPNGVNQFILTPLNSSVAYWSTGEWNGQYYSSIPEMLSHSRVDYKFVNNEHEVYFTYTLQNDTVIMNHLLDVSGQMKTFIWYEGIQDWVATYINPKAQCDVYAVCGPFTVCNENTAQYCSCMKGFSTRSQEDWALNDWSGGCVRNYPLNCGTNRSNAGLIDEFYSMSAVRLPQNAHNIDAATSAQECAQVCLSNCSCTAYSYTDGRCSIWHEELLNVRQRHTDTTDIDGGVLYLRLAAKEMQTQKHDGRVIIGVVTVTSVIALSLLAFILLLMIQRNKKKWSGSTLKNLQGGGGIIAFRYIDLQRATRNFSEKLGGGGFGSVFKGYLSDSTTIAVKRLDGACQGEKQFRAEVSSIGIIQHINLVRLIGFCCEREQRLLAYEHMPNRSLDIHLFQNNGTILNWNTRYGIALGVARGMAYLHESCQDFIIHCDIKPENILLDTSFVAKVADFGLAKLMGRDFSRVLTTIRGTVGYLAPEWISGVAITTKVDVYGYGMVLLEIISGRRNSCVQCTVGGDHVVYFPVLAARMLLKGDVASLVDHKLCGDVNLEEVERLCKVACWCIQDDEYDRPTMGEVVHILEGLFDLDMPLVPRLLHALSESSHPAST